jgi:hypothetical protein
MDLLSVGFDVGVVLIGVPGPGSAQQGIAVQLVHSILVPTELVSSPFLGEFATIGAASACTVFFPSAGCAILRRAMALHLGTGLIETRGEPQLKMPKLEKALVKALEDSAGGSRP